MYGNSDISGGMKRARFKRRAKAKPKTISLNNFCFVLLCACFGAVFPCFGALRVLFQECLMVGTTAFSTKYKIWKLIKAYLRTKLSKKQCLPTKVYTGDTYILYRCMLLSKLARKTHSFVLLYYG
jgi:hypothetical protein